MHLSETHAVQEVVRELLFFSPCLFNCPPPHHTPSPSSSLLQKQKSRGKMLPRAAICTTCRIQIPGGGVPRSSQWIWSRAVAPWYPLTHPAQVLTPAFQLHLTS